MRNVLCLLPKRQLQNIGLQRFSDALLFAYKSVVKVHEIFSRFIFPYILRHSLDPTVNQLFL